METTAAKERAWQKHRCKLLSHHLLCSAAKKAKTEPAAAEHKKGTRAADPASQPAKKAAGNKDDLCSAGKPMLASPASATSQESRVIACGTTVMGAVGRGRCCVAAFQGCLRHAGALHTCARWGIPEASRCLLLPLKLRQPQVPII